jgi:hypothetical protein
MISRRTQRLFWKAALAAVVAGVLAVGALFLWLAFVDIAPYRPRIEALISQSVDREVTIRGDIRLERSLVPRFSVAHVRLANPAWASRPYLANVERIEVRVALWPLFQRRLEIVSLDLIGADVLLERGPRGQNNWQLRPRAAAAEGATSVFGVDLFRLRRSVVAYRDVTGKATNLRVESLNAVWAPERPVTVRGHGRYQEWPVEFSLDAGKLTADAMPPEAWPLQARVNLANTEATFDGTRRLANGGAHTAGSVTWQGEDAEALKILFGFEPPVAGPHRLQAQLALNGKKISFTQLKARWRESEINGELVVAFGKRAQLNARLQSPRLRWDDFYPADKHEADNAPASPSTRAIPDFSIARWQVPFDAIWDVDVAELAGPRGPLGPLRAAFGWRSGVFELRRAQAELLGTPIEAHVRLDASASPPALEVQTTWQRVDYGKLLQRFGVSDRVQGVADVTLRLQGRGATWHAVLGQADGELRMFGTHGRLPRHVLELLAGDLVRLLNPLTWTQDNVTEINCVAVHANLTQGTAKTDLLLLDTKKITIAGELLLDLKTETLRGLLQSRPKDASLFRLDSPIALGGTLREPSAKVARSQVLTWGKVAVSVVQPAAVLVLFSDLGAKDKAPCATLLEQALPKPDADASAVDTEPNTVSD